MSAELPSRLEFHGWWADRSREAEMLEDLPQSILADLVKSQLPKTAAALQEREKEGLNVGPERSMRELRAEIKNHEAAIERYKEASEQTQATLLQWAIGTKAADACPARTSTKTSRFLSRGISSGSMMHANTTGRLLSRPRGNCADQPEVSEVHAFCRSHCE